MLVYSLRLCRRLHIMTLRHTVSAAPTMSRRSLMAGGRQRACIGVGAVKHRSSRLCRTGDGTYNSFHADISARRIQFIRPSYLLVMLDSCSNFFKSQYVYTALSTIFF